MDTHDASPRERDLQTPETTAETPAAAPAAPTAALPADQPTTTALATDQPATDQPATDQPATDQPVAEPLTTALSDAPVEEVRSEQEPLPPATPSASLSPAEDTADADVTRPSGPRTRTIVLGLVLLVISGTGLLRMLAGVHIDDTVVLLTLLIVAGALLLGGGVASAAREARTGRRRT